VSSTLIEHATVVTVDHQGTVLPRGDVLIQGAEIAGVWASEARPAETGTEEVIEAEGMVLIPGLINTHTHAAMTLLRGYADDMPLMPWLQERIWPLEMKLEAEDVYWGTMLGIAEMIRAGVTCFNDMYHYFETAARAAVDSGIRANVSGVLLGFLPGAEARLEHAIEFAEKWRGAGDGRLITMLGPHAPYTCPDRLFRRVVQGAQGAGVGIHIHVSETAGEVADSVREFGMTPVKRLADLGLLDVHPVLAAHCVHVTEEDIALLAGHQVGIAHNPGSNMKLASGVAPVPKLLEAEATVGLGTDGPASNNNLDMIEEARLAALLHKLHTGDPTVVPAPAALAMATREGARALGLGDQVGRIEVGLKADLALLDFSQPHLCPRHDVVSHLVYAARAGDVRTVFINGQCVLRDGAFTTIDEREVCAQARARVERLVGAL
jgi:5-methylthioadenosine/S-adenosylhomocysteine deaminase